MLTYNGAKIKMMILARLCRFKSFYCYIGGSYSNQGSNLLALDNEVPYEYLLSTIRPARPLVKVGGPLLVGDPGTGPLGLLYFISGLAGQP